MSVFSKIKRAFGFSNLEEESETDSDARDLNSPERTPYINPFKTEAKEVATPIADEKVEAKTKEETCTEQKPQESEEFTFPDTAMDGLIDMINANLPEFVRKCIDKTAQKKYIYDSMGESFKNCIADIKKHTIENETLKFKEYKDSSETKLSKLSEDLNGASQKVEEAQNQFLSSERQKRALSERIHEMEGQIAKLESEREQFELENKSLLNKLKVVQVKTDDVEYFKSENERIQLEMNKLKLSAVKNDDIIKDIEEKTAKIEQLEVEKADIEAAKAIIEKEKAELQESISDIELAKEKEITDIKKQLEITVTMLNSMRVQNAEYETKVKTLEATKPTGNSEEVAEFKEKLRQASAQIESLQDELNEASSNLEIVEQIQEQLDKVDEMKRKKDEKIEQLTVSIKQRDIDNATLNNQIKELRKELELKDKSFSLKMKEISAMYEAELQKKENLKKAEGITFDMSELEPIQESKPVQQQNDIIEIDEINIAKPQITAIDAHDKSNWLKPSPPSPPTIDVFDIDDVDDDEIIGIEKNPTKQDDTLQMSLF